MNKPSVAIIGTRGYPSYYGGFETLVRRLAPALVDSGWDVSVYGRPGAVKADDDDRDDRVNSITTRGFETKSLSTLTYGLTSIAHSAKRKPDVALIMNVANGFWLPILKARGIPTIVNVDGIEWERAKWGKGAKRVFKSGAGMTARYADVLVSDSKEIQRRWSEEFNRSSVFIPYGGSDPGGSEVPSELAGRKYVLAVARFVPENTIPEFIQAAKTLSEKWDVVIVGSSGYDGPLDNEVRDLASRSTRIHWMGHVSDDRALFALWRNASAYFHGHSVGGTNPALVQAMACGAPTVARDTVYNREVLGDAAIFTSPEPSEIARKIDFLLENDRLQNVLRADVIERSSEFYTWDLVCTRYEELMSRSVSKDKNLEVARTE